MTIKTRKNSAWRVFSEYIRRKNADNNGFVTCFTCNTRMFWKESEAGHGIGGRGNFILFLEEVVKPQCSYCNKYLKGNYEVFIPKIISEIGQKAYENLVFEARRPIKMLPIDYLEIEDRYKDKLEELWKT